MKNLSSLFMMKKIKILRMDKGKEYYDRYTQDGQVPDPFAKFL